MYINMYRCQQSKVMWGGKPAYRWWNRVIEMDDNRSRNKYTLILQWEEQWNWIQDMHDMLFKYGLEELINTVTLKEIVCQRKKRDHFLLRLEEVRRAGGVKSSQCVTLKK